MLIDQQPPRASFEKSARARPDDAFFSVSGQCSVTMSLFGQQLIHGRVRGGPEIGQERLAAAHRTPSSAFPNPARRCGSHAARCVLPRFTPNRFSPAKSKPVKVQPKSTRPLRTCSTDWLHLPRQHEQQRHGYVRQRCVFSVTTAHSTPRLPRFKAGIEIDVVKPCRPRGYKFQVWAAASRTCGVTCEWMNTEESVYCPECVLCWEGPRLREAIRGDGAVVPAFKIARYRAAIVPTNKLLPSL